MQKRIKQALIAWLEKYSIYFKTDLVYLFTGGFWLTFGRGITALTSFALTITLAYFLTKETYGTYKYILSVFGIISLTTLRGMDDATAQAVARNYDGSIKPALYTRIRYGFIGFFLGIAGAVYYRHNSAIAISFLIASVFIPFMDPPGLYAAVLNGKKLFKQNIIYQSVSQMIAAGVLITTVILTKNIYGVVLVYFGVWTLCRWFFWRRTLTTVAINDRADPETISYGKHSSVINISASIIASLDSVLIFHFLGAADLARYTFAIAPVMHLLEFFNPLTTLAMPKLAQRTATDIQPLLIKRIVMLMGLAIIFIGGLIKLMPYFFKIFFPQYTDSVQYAQFFSIYLLFALPSTIFGAAISSKLTSTPKRMLYLWNIPSIVMILFTLLTVRHFGVFGVIGSRIFGVMTGFLISVCMWMAIRKMERAAEQQGV